MSAKLWQIAAVVSLFLAGLLLVVPASSNLPRLAAMLLVFLSLWLTKQRRDAEKLKQSDVLRGALVEKS